ncbi:MAG: hypothetical protein KDE27_28565 [Planctomycetes bacterium]|nr:hypothetical protein [Planctomycetota bacterium]
MASASKTRKHPGKQGKAVVARRSAAQKTTAQKAAGQKAAGQKPAGRRRAATAARPKPASKAKTKTDKKSQAAERSAPALAEVDADALEFIAAIDRFKAEHGRPFPSWSEILLVLRSLGYRKS